MKLLYCPACGSLTELKIGIMKYCTCKKVSGKYCDDTITAVVHEDAIVVGIDNNSFKQAKINYDHTKDWKDRIDFYFTGWIPNKPGEIIRKKTNRAVSRFKLQEKDYIGGSTIPTKSA